MVAAAARAQKKAESSPAGKRKPAEPPTTPPSRKKAKADAKKAEAQEKMPEMDMQNDAQDDAQDVAGFATLAEETPPETLPMQDLELQLPAEQMPPPPMQDLALQLSAEQMPPPKPAADLKKCKCGMTHIM